MRVALLYPPLQGYYVRVYVVAALSLLFDDARGLEGLAVVCGKSAEVGRGT